MNKLYFRLGICTLLTLLLVQRVHAQAFQWVNGSAGKGIHGGGKISSDYKNNAYLAENIDGDFVLDTTHYNDRGFVVLKYNPQGKYVRGKVVRGAHVNSVSAGLYGDYVVTGYYDSAVIFDTTHLKAGTSRNIFTAKYDTGGNLLWVKSLNGTNIEGRAVCADPYGNTYVAGVFQFTIGGVNTVVSQGGNDIFVAKYDTVGTLLWVKRAGGGKDDAPTAICADVAGNLYASGYFEDNASFGAVSLISAGGKDIFVTRFNSVDGTIAWANSYGGPNDEQATSISADASGRTYISGFYNGTVQFATMQLTSKGQKDIFLILNNSAGKFQWAHSAGGVNGIDEGLGLVCDGQSSAFLTGHFRNPVSFDDLNLDGDSNDDVFVAKYAVNGKLIWLKKAGGTGGIVGTGICRNADGDLLITGTIKGEISFDKKTFKGDSSGSLFITKLLDAVADIKPNADIESLINVYPNPAHHQLNITVSGIKVNKVMLTSISGQQVYITAQTKGDVLNIPLSNFKPGLYIITVQHDGGVYNQRLVIE